VSSSPIEPLTVGGIRPSILISQNDLDRLSEPELLPILTHECVHIQRRDLILSLVPWLAQTLFWFLPPVYLAMHEFQLTREVCLRPADGHRIGYGAPSLWRTAGQNYRHPLSPLPVPSSTMALSAGFQNLKRRIEMLEIKQSPSSRPINGFPDFRWPDCPLALHCRRPALSFRIAAKPSISQQESPTGKRWQTVPIAILIPSIPWGVDSTILHDDKPSGYVKSNANIADDVEGDGGVLRYDIPAKTYVGKRLRWSGYVQGKGLKKTHAFLFIAAEGKNGLSFATSSEIPSRHRGLAEDGLYYRRFPRNLLTSRLASVWRAKG